MNIFSEHTISKNNKRYIKKIIDTKRKIIDIKKTSRNDTEKALNNSQGI